MKLDGKLPDDLRELEDVILHDNPASGIPQGLLPLLPPVLGQIFQRRLEEAALKVGEDILVNGSAECPRCGDLAVVWHGERAACKTCGWHNGMQQIGGSFRTVELPSDMQAKIDLLKQERQKPTEPRRPKNFGPFAGSKKKARLKAKEGR